MADAQWTGDQRLAAAKFVEQQMKTTGIYPSDGFPIEEVWAIVDESWDRLHGDNKENFVDSIETSLKDGLGNPIFINVHDVDNAANSVAPAAEAPAAEAPQAPAEGSTDAGAPTGTTPEGHGAGSSITE